MPLDRANLTTAASLNRLRFTPTPGIPIPVDMIGRSAFDLLSAEAIAERVERNRIVLALDTKSSVPVELLPAFDRCFEAQDTTLRHEAERIAGEVGRTLGTLLLTLKLGHDASRAARPDWDESYWAAWGVINSIWLGGGLVSGNFGGRLAAHAQTMVREAGYTDYRVQVSPYKGLMSLVGLARQVPIDTTSALVFDCGGTYIKRALAHYRGSTLVELNPLSRIAAPCHVPFEDFLQEASHVMSTILNSISAAYHASDDVPGNTIGISLGCYLYNGQPFDRGCYGCLRLLSDNLEQFIAAELTHHLARPITVMLRHDGTAAAAAHAGTGRSAAIMLGTALGVGFAPSAALPITVDEDKLSKSI